MPRFLTYGDKGERVERLQRLLNKNRFHTFRRKLAVDGEMGPLTCGAVKNLKYWMGYHRDDMDPDVADQIAGGFLFDLLSGKRPLPAEYKKRRARRLKKAAEAAAQRPLRLKILDAAKEDVGLLEGPNNRIKYNDWWPDGVVGDGDNDGGAYCVRAGTYWAWKAGFRKHKWENTDDLLADAKAGRNGVHITHDPDAGHGFVIDWEGHADPDHFGLHVEDAEGGEFKSLEANATLKNGRQGVGYHFRPAWQCWFIVFED